MNFLLRHPANAGIQSPSKFVAPGPLLAQGRRKNLVIREGGASRVTRYRPADENQLTETIAAAMNREEPMEVIAGGSKRALGRKVAAAHVLDLSAFSGIGLYEPEELVLTAGPATPLAEIEAALGAHRQHLAFEPPDWRQL